MQAILEFIRMNAKDGSPIMFIGEEGTGRRLMALLLREAGAPDQRVVRFALPDQHVDGCQCVALPPLRARREDIRPLTDLFLRENIRGAR